MTESAAFRLSIVIPVYRGESTVSRLVDVLRGSLGDRYDLEIILVNDGSPDASANVCRSMAQQFSEVKFINLSRNFGEHCAVMAGLNVATGECTVTMDDDFQNPPEEVEKLVEELRTGYDIVYSYYEAKQHHWLRNLGSQLTNRVATILLQKPSGLYLSSFKAISRFAVQEVVKYRGPYPYVDGLLWRATTNFSRVLVQHAARVDGKSGYTPRKLVSLYMNMFVNFSVLPLRLASLLGLLVSLIGVVMATIFVIEKIYYPGVPSGWTSLTVIVLMVSGVQLFALGMIGEYLGRLFLMNNGAPQFVVREVVDLDA
jgi:glycosyltransferase involved in cell wall biosynthesis